MSGTPGFIPPHGNYKELRSYQKAEVVYDITYRFCRKFLKKGDRTIDQMVQAARSGKQNIVEGVRASGGSKEMEIKLLNVARASLEELLADYEDFLRVRDFPIWKKDSKEAQYVRKLGNQPSRLMRPIGKLPKPGLPRWWLISPSVSFIRPIIYSTGK